MARDDMDNISLVIAASKKRRYYYPMTGEGVRNEGDNLAMEIDVTYR